MDTHPEIFDGHSALAWRPFGDAAPAPRRRGSPTGWRTAATEPPRRTFPLWLPFVVALALGALIWIAALLAGTNPPASADADLDRRDATAVVLVGEAAPASSVTESARLAAAILPARRPLRRHAAAPAVFAPERVSDLKPNPFAAPARPAPLSPSAFAPERVSDLKANPYR